MMWSSRREICNWNCRRAQTTWTKVLKQASWQKKKAIQLNSQMRPPRFPVSTLEKRKESNLFSCVDFLDIEWGNCFLIPMFKCRFHRSFRHYALYYELSVDFLNLNLFYFFSLICKFKILFMFTFWRLGYKKIDDARRPPYCGSPWPATLDTPRLWTPAFCDFGPPFLRS